MNDTTKRERERGAILYGKVFHISEMVESEILRKHTPSELQMGLLETELANALCEYAPEMGRQAGEAKAEEYLLEIRKEHEQEAERLKHDPIVSKILERFRCEVAENKSHRSD